MRTAVVVLALSFAAIAATVHAGDLAVEPARSVVQTSEDAWKRMDFGTSAALHSSDCMATDTSPDDSGKLVTTTTRCSGMFESGAKLLADIKADGGQLQYDSTINAATKQGDKVIVSLHEVVTMSMNGHAMRMEADQQETVQSRDGKLLITASDSKATRKIVDGQRVY